MVINTSGLEYDDRLRKECLSLQKLGHDVEILALEYANEEGQETVYGKIPATKVHLRSRNWFSQRSMLWAKTLELYGRFLAKILKSKPDAIWCHDLVLTGFIPILVFLRKIAFFQHLVWDQHELFSDRVLRSQFAMRFLVWLFNGCDSLVSANAQRRALLVRLTGARLRVPIRVLENFPDQFFTELPCHDLPAETILWLEGQSYILAQGGAAPDRHFPRLVEAVVGLDDLRLIVIGPYLEAQVAEIRERFGALFDRRVLLTGLVPQKDIVPYIDHALASVVLYEMTTENTRLPAPNRLYQAVCRGTPVVVGANASMAEFVHRWDCGSGLSGDGQDADDVREGIKAVLSRQGEYRRNAQHCRSSVSWESQLLTISDIMEQRTRSS